MGVYDQETLRLKYVREKIRIGIGFKAFEEIQGALIRFSE